MKLCFLALYNTVNVMVYDTLKKEKTSTLMSQKLYWADLCKAFLMETTWGRLQEEVDRGETANSIACMMSGSLCISEESARQYTSNLVENSWKNLNKDGACASPCTKQFVKAARNLARISQCIYQYGDEHGAPVMSKESNPISDYRSHLKTITQTHIYAGWLLATKRVEFILVSWSISNMH
ncbi:hypothetical protein DVH24_021533 [Malus domestica]|uniref:Terpene synthase metal-binding domain-containing protein n=1 Tax=Malus domestica TaxID=3750 RepID=A0A498K3A4_MALDO|nr:hypothetical protein DVH24_021533 [Malus domestica]